MTSARKKGLLSIWENTQHRCNYKRQRKERFIWLQPNYIKTENRRCLTAFVHASFSRECLFFEESCQTLLTPPTAEQIVLFATKTNKQANENPRWRNYTAEHFDSSTPTQQAFKNLFQNWINKNIAWWCLTFFNSHCNYNYFGYLNVTIIQFSLEAIFSILSPLTTKRG